MDANSASTRSNRDQRSPQGRRRDHLRLRICWPRGRPTRRKGGNVDLTVEREWMGEWPTGLLKIGQCSFRPGSLLMVRTSFGAKKSGCIPFEIRNSNCDSSCPAVQALFLCLSLSRTANRVCLFCLQGSPSPKFPKSRQCVSFLWVA